MPAAPLYRDPVFDGATDPCVVRREGSREWWMFYTQRRPHVDEPGVAWIHGTAIGVAVSTDGDVWDYRGTVGGLDAGGNTHWAPEVIWDGARYRMYLTVVPGIPDRWEGHPRSIVEYRSDDLERWELIGTVPLGSDRVIDAAVALCGDDMWRLWYKNESDDSTTWAASSPDLESWTVEGRVIGGRPHEGPNVFRLGGLWWMIVDEWRGQAVYRSDDAVSWTPQADLILAAPGIRPLDATVGRHADVVVRDGEAVIFYFTHPWWDGEEIADAAGARSRLSCVQAARLAVEGGILVCDRDDASRLRWG